MFSELKHGKLHYRALERDKILGLLENYSACIEFSGPAVADVVWWQAGSRMCLRQAKLLVTVAMT